MFEKNWITKFEIRVTFRMLSFYLALKKVYIQREGQKQNNGTDRWTTHSNQVFLSLWSTLVIILFMGLRGARFATRKSYANHDGDCNEHLENQKLLWDGK